MVGRKVSAGAGVDDGGGEDRDPRRREDRVDAPRLWHAGEGMVGARRGGGRELLVVNTHWDHVGEQARRASARLVRVRATTLAQGAPVLVMGDFNTPIDTSGPDDAGWILRDGAGDGLPRWLDTWRATAAPATGTFHAFTGTPQSGRIDAILATAEFAVLAAAVVDTSVGAVFPSDHFPVTAVVRLDR